MKQHVSRGTQCPKGQPSGGRGPWSFWRPTSLKREPGHLTARLHQHVIMNDPVVFPPPPSLSPRRPPALRETPHPRVASRGGMKGSLPSRPARPLSRFPWASPWTAAVLGKAASPAPASSPSQHSVPWASYIRLTSPGWPFTSWHSSSVLLGPFPDTPLTPRLGEHPCCERPTLCPACFLLWTRSFFSVDTGQQSPAESGFGHLDRSSEESSRAVLP